MSVGEVPGHAAEQHGVRDPIGDRIEERAPRSGGAGGFGHGAVEGVGKTGEHEQEETERQETGGDGHRGTRRHEHADGGEAIGGDTHAQKTSPDGLEALLDVGSPASVEHGTTLAAGPSGSRHTPSGRHTPTG